MIWTRVVKGCSKNSFQRVESYSFIEIEFRKIKKNFDKNSILSKIFLQLWKKIFFFEKKNFRIKIFFRKFIEKFDRKVRFIQTSVPKKLGFWVWVRVPPATRTQPVPDPNSSGIYPYPTRTRPENLGYLPIPDPYPTRKPRVSTLNIKIFMIFGFDL